jgi:glycosyltransferase involved in cell wall biosynthesis
VLVDDAADLDAVGAAIDGLLDDTDRAHAIGAQARERVRHSFLGTRSLVQYMQLIDKMLHPQ